MDEGVLADLWAYWRHAPPAGLLALLRGKRQKAPPVFIAPEDLPPPDAFARMAETMNRQLMGRVPRF